MRKREEDPPRGAPLWMTTYGDMVTLVLTFFVLLFSFAQIDKDKYIQIANSLRGALGGKTGVLQSGNTVMDDQSGEQTPAVVTEEFKEIMAKLETDIDKTGNIEIYQDQRGLVISFKEKLFFAIGKADIRPEALDVLNKIGQILKGDRHQIRVEGHTCDLPIRTSIYPTNWELSTARATNVTRYLIERVGLSPERLSVAGYGPYRPIVENISEINRARNRRVDIVLLSSNDYRN